MGAHRVLFVILSELHSAQRIDKQVIRIIVVRAPYKSTVIAVSDFSNIEGKRLDLDVCPGNCVEIFSWHNVFGQSHQNPSDQIDIVILYQ